MTTSRKHSEWWSVVGMGLVALAGLAWVTLIAVAFLQPAADTLNAVASWAQTHVWWVVAGVPAVVLGVVVLRAPGHARRAQRERDRRLLADLRAGIEHPK